MRTEVYKVVVWRNSLTLWQRIRALFGLTFCIRWALVETTDDGYTIQAMEW